MTPSPRDTSTDDGMNIKPGSVISNGKNDYVVMRLLGEGGFGAVYKVYNKEDKTKEYAMKVEKKMEKRKHSKLKMEVAILKQISEIRGSSHFTAIIDRGKKEKYFFLVMTLVGKSLDDLKRQRPNRVFTLGTGFGVAIQCLEAIEDLTHAGFIHRDIKPANYACGLGDKAHTVYLLDFGIARRIVNDENELKTPRQQVGFKGTVRFASLSCHHGVELGPKDDCESWFYLLLDLVMVGGLPWRRFSEKNEVLKIKEDCHQGRDPRLFHGLNRCQGALAKILEYINSLNYSDKVDYKFLYKLVRMAGVECNVDIFGKYDWELEENSNNEVTRMKASDEARNSSTRKVSQRTTRN